jgi:hypothetical protein
LQAFSTVFSSIVQFTIVFASRDCINSFSTGILLYKGFTFDTPEYCNCTSDRSANPKVLYVARAPLLYIRPLNIYQSYIILYTRSSTRSVSYKHLAPLPYYSPSFYQDSLCPTRTNSVSRVYSTVLFARHYFTYALSCISYSNIYTRSPVASLDCIPYIYQSVQYLILRSALYISVCTVFDTTISLILYCK